MHKFENSTTHTTPQGSKIETKKYYARCLTSIQNATMALASNPFGFLNVQSASNIIASYLQIKTTLSKKIIQTG